MSHLLEMLGRGLGNELGDMLDRYYWRQQMVPLAELKRACEVHPNWPDMQLQLGLHHMRSLALPEAIERLSQACRVKPDYMAAHVALAAALEQQGQLELALDHLKIANELKPDQVGILFAMGFVHERLRRPGQAAELYAEVIEKDANFMPARERLAAVDIVLDRIDDAIVQYEAMRLVEPQDCTIRASLAHLYHRAGHYAQAISEFEQAIAMEPENWSLVDDEVEAMIQSGQTREAIERLLGLVDQQGNFPDLHVRLGDLYSSVGDDAAATNHYQAALDMQPRYLEATVKLATHHLSCGRWEEAAELFHRGSELNDHLLLNYVGIAVSHLSAGNRDEAMKTLELAAAVEPNSTLLLSEMTRLQLKAAVADEFMAAFEGGEQLPSAEAELDNDHLLEKQVERHARQVSAHPHHADLRYRYGVLLRSQGRLGEAVEEFAAAVAINPCYVQAILKLGISQQELGRVDEAMETFKSALEIKPQYVDIHYRLGLLYTDRKDFEQAASHLLQASDGAPDNEQFRAALALALQNLGLLDKAAATWRSLWRIHQESTRNARPH